jgi:hypothetical protein
MSTKNCQKMPIFFHCKTCDFSCSKESNYLNHISTRKHKNQQNVNNLKHVNSLLDNDNVCLCGKTYKERTGLWRHRKKCPMVLKNEEACDNNNIVPDIDNAFTKDELLLKLIKNNDEMMKIIKGQQEQINSIIPKIGNITNNTNNTTNNTMNNNFNLNVFLNEHCKDALNISDFIDSLKITLEDLLFSKTNGISRGITDVLIKGLKELDIYKRPIHCTDIKRDIMYIKDEDKWLKDDSHDIMKNTIIKIADKERTALQQWAIDNPDWMETERKQLEYLTMMRSICEPIENYNNYERKIIKNISKEILVDKK